MPDKCRILLADDHSMFRDGLRRMLESESDFEVAAEASDGKSAIQTAKRIKPEVILLDLSMPGTSGLRTLKDLTKAVPESKTIMLTASITDQEIVEALQCGARGIVLKEASSQHLFKAIRCVCKGEYWVTRDSIGNLVQALNANGSSKSDSAPQPKNFRMTPRELEIVGLVVQGYTNPEIAERCSISEQTVKHHITNIFDKLGVYNRVELALFAVNHNLTQG
jgi:DNA-binding NarL/FixJ family response regulator